jgi:hypothetical protein
MKIAPDAKDYPVLEAGFYGNGLDHEAEVTLTEFTVPGMADFENPRFDPEGERGPYANLKLKVYVNENSTIYFVDHVEPFGSNSGSKLVTFLEAMGVETWEDPDGQIEYDESTVAPRKLAGVELSAPTTSKKTGRKYNGKVRQVIAS